MIRFILFFSLIFCAGSAECSLKDLKKSIFKIMVETKDGPSVATIFAVVDGNRTVLVTNNHVCDGFYSAKKVLLIKSETRDCLPQYSKDCSELDKITEYYMEPGSDICIAKSEGMTPYPGLKMSDVPVEVTDQVMVSGFVGRSMNLMYVEGRAYGIIDVIHPFKLEDCMISPPEESSASEITCQFFNSYPSYITSKMMTGVNNIGPGFSGSPILKNGLVSGIVSRYYIPSRGYSNGDAIFFNLDDLKLAIENSRDRMVPILSREYEEFIRISKFDQSLIEYTKWMGESPEDYIKRLWKEANE